MDRSKGNGAQPTPEQMAMMMAQQRAAAMLARRETLSGIILNGMLAGMAWEPTGTPYPKDMALEVAKDAVTFAEALLQALYPQPPEAANAEAPKPEDKPPEQPPGTPAPIEDPPASE